MTVFMGTRQNYQLSRYQQHSTMACVVFLMMVCAFLFTGAVKERPGAAMSVVIPVAALCSKRGRKHGRRLVSETFYGVLFKFTGVYYTGKHASKE